MNMNQYFHRTVVFTLDNNQVALADIDHPGNTTPLEDWMGVVLSLADGKHTLQELNDYMSQQYPQPPANLKETLRSVVERLEESKLIELNDNAVELPYYLASPIEKLDLDKARALIKEDGFGLH